MNRAANSQGADLTENARQPQDATTPAVQEHDAMYRQPASMPVSEGAESVGNEALDPACTTCRERQAVVEFGTPYQALCPQCLEADRPNLSWCDFHERLCEVDE